MVLVEQSRLKWREILAFDGKGNRRAFFPNCLNDHASGTGFGNNSYIVPAACQRAGFADIGCDSTCLREPGGFFRAMISILE